MNHEIEDERERRERRRRLMAERKRRSRRLKLIYACIRKFGPYAAGLVAAIVLVCVGVSLSGNKAGNVQAGQESGAYEETAQGGTASVEEEAPMEADAAMEESQSAEEGAPMEGSSSPAGQTQEAEDTKEAYSANVTAQTAQLGADIDSGYAILIDLDTGNVLAQKQAEARINPASMTKVLTVLVAAEHVENLDDTFTITLNETDYSYVNDCSSVGFAENEEVTVRDLFYGTILPSGGDAAAGLAAYVAGSREAFVELMNEKLAQLGLSDTAHMTNCVGLYDEDHYCTVYDMAMIMEAALDNELCREVLSAHTYTTSSTPQHPEGITISNWFLRRIEDKDTGGEVICGKTGYVVQSGSCAASYGRDVNGREYVCVTADAGSSWKCIYDHVALYKEASGT